ncbi:MAG: lipid-A-disaccharide synthase N-terminal domain-containing protein [Planctomycetes bacterium]|nr:lipid-A-disaccharide synthase N-terminal domain-containing protein [Planctomycetota bacterium]
MLAFSLADAAATPWFWLAIGFVGQAIFGTRFLVQWIATERAKRVIVPALFWHMSIVGGLLLLSYAIYQRDPVFIVGQVTGTLVYVRNLVIRGREKNAPSEA